MKNIISLLGTNFATLFAITISVCVVVILAVVLFFMWWVDVKKKTIKSFFAAIANGIYKIGKKVGNVFSDESVKTVYSNKNLNYSGTEYLPIPSKEPSSKFTYEFMGWEKCGTDENGDIVVKAIYMQKTKKCYVNAYDEDRVTLLKSFEVEFGAGIDVSGLHPQKPETKEFSYEFAGWDKDVSAFYKNENIYAVYRAIPKKFTYTFLDHDEEIIVCQGTAIYGSPIIPPSPPVRQNEDGKVFVFSGWKNYREGDVLTRNCNFIAEYKTISEKNVLGSTVIDTNGEQLKVDSVQTIANVSNQPELSAKQRKEKREKEPKAIAPKMDYADILKQNNKSKKEQKLAKKENTKEKGKNISKPKTEEQTPSQGLHKIDLSAVKDEKVEPKSFAEPVNVVHEPRVVKATPIVNSKYQKGDFMLSISAEDDEDMKDITPMTAKKTKDITKTIPKPDKKEPSPFANVMVNKVKIDKKK